jgi:hypothetical protein
VKGLASINLYICSDENNKITKNNLSGLKQYIGVFRDEVNVMTPVFQIETTDNLSGYNYAYIAEFGRYYFVKDIKAVRNGLWEFSLAVDVLMSYAAAILALPAVIRRNAGLFNMYLNDNQYQTLNYPRIQTKLFPQGFGDWNFVLTTVGKGGNNQGG